MSYELSLISEIFCIDILPDRTLAQTTLKRKRENKGRLKENGSEELKRYKIKLLNFHVLPSNH